MPTGKSEQMKCGSNWNRWHEPQKQKERTPVFRCETTSFFDDMNQNNTLLWKGLVLLDNDENKNQTGRF